MKNFVVLCLLAFVAGASAQCVCKNLKWGTCEDNPCKCTVPVDDGTRLLLDCNQLIPKCYLMKAEMYRARNNLTTRSIGGKPVETAVVDNDGIYDPVCEADGRFKAVQCNNTDTCWCVNSAGVRRSDKGDKNIKCEPAETYAIETLLLSRYSIPKELVKDVKYDQGTRMIVADVVKPEADRATDLPRMAYYMEKDVKVVPLFKDQAQFQFPVSGSDVPLEKILVYYVDDKAPTFTMKALTGGVIAVIVVVVLAVVIGLLVLFFLRRREQAQYSKSQHREMAPMSS
ncbi:hypothetical protein NFI96_027079 [Prochilodus magdalenae]|nr:hypothetical protein NFI96_027079 [Prochilodus magdalenae]